MIYTRSSADVLSLSSPAAQTETEASKQNALRSPPALGLSAWRKEKVKKIKEQTIVIQKLLVKLILNVDI